ncbi:MAG TPA: NFACT RNA binding domain-containing protein [Anaeromyxobacteraceae bacterium]|nr:NFACT RNA binding domain-containing protein [Anaeromyxobacteraceae bacterium]
MSITPLELRAVVDELAPLLGARVETVRVHAEREMTLSLFFPAGAFTLLVSAEPGRARLHVASRRPTAPATPFPFQVLLRRELTGARLAAITLPEERVARIVFDRARGQLTLLAELFTRDGNLFLLDKEEKLLSGASRDLVRDRHLTSGEVYRSPPPRERSSREPSSLEPAGSGPFPLSAALEERDRAREAARALEEGRRRLLLPVRAGLARADRTLDKLSEEAARVPAAYEDRRLADLLKQNLHAVQRGSKEVVLTEWTPEGPRSVRVTLDPALSARDNMERYYRRYRRIADSAARVEARRAEVSARREELAQLFRAVETAREEDLHRLEREARRLAAGPRPPPRPRRARDAPLPPYRLFRSLQGVALLVGRNAEANDELTVTVARGNDLWLHARGRGGAHVVAKLEKGKAPDGDTLLDAAHLAAHFSDARGEPVVEVVVTRAKFVKKKKGTPPGAVTYSQERTLNLRVEPPRVERLLASEETA